MPSSSTATPGKHPTRRQSSAATKSTPNSLATTPSTSWKAALLHQRPHQAREAEVATAEAAAGPPQRRSSVGRGPGALPLPAGAAMDGPRAPLRDRQIFRRTGAGRREEMNTQRSHHCHRRHGPPTPELGTTRKCRGCRRHIRRPLLRTKETIGMTRTCGSAGTNVECFSVP